ncbi:competence protein CoiA [Siminovitchia fordii]|uniref:Competence protein n=1 Tax=Siminovitchia fordii TaxID=254759 RepID=A0ABQ4K0C1_9BACI|nr:competence protein CoiA family protein [Siminovitchia fordii]GIN19224.1 competence protein [Siminovitchia fordii]
MLTALNKKGELFTLLGEMREQVLHLREHEQFFCPICKEPLILKAGHVRIPHFSHHQHSQCIETASEPESPKHLKGKLDLFEWCLSNQLAVSLEYYLPDIKQRPDLLIEKAGRLIAIEFQCTPISVRSVEKRSLQYLLSGITPLWIVGGQPFHKKRTIDMFELTEYHWSLTRRKNKHVMLAGYEPESGKASILNGITPFTSKKVFAKLHQMPISKIKIPLSLITDNANFPIVKWSDEKRNWIQQRVRHGDLVRDSFLRAIYTEGSNPFLLSPLIGLPVNYMESFISHPVEWQFFIWSDCLKKLKLNRKISLKYVNYKLRERITKGDIVCRTLPLHDKNQWEKAVRHYFRLLEQLFYFQSAGKDLYRLIRFFPWAPHVEETKSYEKKVMGALIKNNG